MIVYTENGCGFARVKEDSCAYMFDKGDVNFVSHMQISNERSNEYLILYRKGKVEWARKAIIVGDTITYGVPEQAEEFLACGNGTATATKYIITGTSLIYCGQLPCETLNPNETVRV